MSDDALAQMRSLVRSRPTITLRELANALGFAEERSVYYWLRKGGHKGLKEFKASVLAAHLPEADAGGAGAPAGVATGSRSQEELGSVVLETNEYSPWLLPGDRLVLAPGRAPQDGQLAVIALPGEPYAVRRFVVGPPPLLVHPADSRKVTRVVPAEQPRWHGTVVRVVREAP